MAKRYFYYRMSASPRDNIALNLGYTFMAQNKDEAWLHACMLCDDVWKDYRLFYVVRLSKAEGQATIKRQWYPI